MKAMKLVDYYWDHPDLQPFERPFKKGEFLFHQGEAGDAMYIIRRGAVELVVERDKKVLVFGYEDAGNFIGERAIVGDKYRRAFGARAATDLSCLVLRMKDVEKIEAKNPALTRDMLKHMFVLAAERLDAANRLAELLRSSRNVERFVRLVLHFAHFKDGRRNPESPARVHLNIDRVRYYIDMGDHEIETCFKELEKARILVPDGKGFFRLKNEKALLRAVSALREALPELTVI